MKMTRLLSLLLAIIMMIAMVGCQQGTTQPTTSTTAEAANTSAAAQAASVSAEPTKITYYRPGISQKCLTDFSDALWVQELEKKMNVKIEFQGPKTTDDYNQAAAIMLNSGTLTDMFYYDFSRYDGGLSSAIEDGIAVNVSEKYKDKMPNWFSILEKSPEIRKAVTLDDGTSAIFNHVDENMARSAYWGLGIRADWLKKLNLQTPTTMDELYNVLVAFRDKDPNGNGKKDEIPFCDYYLSGANYMFAIMDITASFGLLYKEVQQDPGNPGKVNYWINVNDGKNFQELVTTLNKWYKEKLLDPEFSTQDGTALESKVTSDVVGMTHVWPSGFNTWNSALRKTVPDADLEGLTPMSSANSKAYSANSALVRHAAGNAGTVITTQAEEDGTVDACLKLIDYMYSSEGSDLINWGVKDVSYTENSDGTKSWTDTLTKDPTYSLNDLQFKYALPTFGDFPKVMSYDSWASIELNSQEAVRAHDLWYKADQGLLLPALTLNSDESTEYAKIMNDVDTAITENFIKFIIGTRPVSEVPDLVQQCKGYGIEKAMSMYQSAYDRYNKK
jgi:putative aldouronate transport system substrate-binding protein